MRRVSRCSLIEIAIKLSGEKWAVLNQNYILNMNRANGELRIANVHLLRCIASRYSRGQAVPVH